jgi:hypothetical protein
MAVYKNFIKYNRPPEAPADRTTTAENNVFEGIYF